MARGTHGRQGPPPDPLALRRDRRSDMAGWITLPADGRAGDPPEWPLSDPLDRELQLWASEWRRPQAVKWEENGQQVEVALYVRCLVAAESPLAKVAMRVLVVRQQEYLGISMPGLARNRWRIGTPPPAPVPPSPRRTKGRDTSVRARMQAIDGGAA
ncbi:MAG: hypothetical protein ABMA25_09665 [Ilumatobacteraceae bacterium]